MNHSEIKEVTKSLQNVAKITNTELCSILEALENDGIIDEEEALEIEAQSEEDQ